MSLYISRNGQQHGPYSLAEAQSLVQAGTLVETDWAWQEGLPDWVPLHQFPGLAPHTPASNENASPSTTTPPSAEAINKPAPAKDKSLLQKIGGGLAAVGYAAFKFKAIAFGALKTGLSMLFMIWLYSTLFGWPFAVGLILLIFVHEMGHVIAAKCLGIPVSAPLFIPFFGAMITMKENPRDAWTEALMAYGGPLAGSIGSWICLGIGLQLDSPIWIAVASVSFVINLYNMIPVPPLDGGRICSAISPWFWLIGIVLLGAALFYFHSLQSAILIGIIVVLYTIPRMKQTFFGTPSPEMQAYYNTHISNRLTMSLMYLGLLSFLILGYWMASSHLADLWDNSGQN